MSRNTVRKYVKMLEDKQLICTEPTEIRTANGVKRNGNLLYTIQPIEQPMSFHLKQQLQRAVSQRSNENTILKNRAV